MDSINYVPESHLTFSLPATSPTDSSFGHHSHHYLQGSYPRTPNPETSHPSEFLENSACFSERYSYQLPLLRGFDISHLRQDGGYPQVSETRTVRPILDIQEAPRGRLLRRLSPSIGRSSPRQYIQLSNSVDFTVDTWPPSPSALTEYGEYQRPVVVQPSDIHAQFGLGSSRPLSPFACRRPLSSPPPIPPRATALFLSNRRRQRHTTTYEGQRPRGGGNGSSGLSLPPAGEASIGQMRAMPVSTLSHGGIYATDLPQRNSIVSVDIVPEEDRNCRICYEKYGIPNHEGVIEHPFMLYKCRHIFGSICIKKWFGSERKTTCPLCRCKCVSDHELLDY